MDIPAQNQEKIISLAREVLLLSRNTLLVNLRFLDVALSQFELIPIDTSTLMTDGKNILYNPLHVLESYRTARENPVRDYLHIVMHCVFRHMYVDPTLNRQYWDLACDIAVENVITELNLRAVTSPRVRRQEEYIKNIKSNLKYITAEKIYAYLRLTEPDSSKIAEIRECFYADDHEIWYMTGEQATNSFGSSNSDNSDNSGNSDNSDGSDGSSGSGGNSGESKTDNTLGVSPEMSVTWQEISERMQVDLETFGKQRGLNPGAMTQNLAEVNREKYDYTAFLKKFAVMGEAMRINDDEFDYIFYTYGLRLYKNMPLIEPLEYKEIKAIKEFVIAIDTSGSTSGDLVQKFVQKTYNMQNLTSVLHCLG